MPKNNNQAKRAAVDLLKLAIDCSYEWGRPLVFADVNLAMAEVALECGISPSLGWAGYATVEAKLGNISESVRFANFIVRLGNEDIGRVDTFGG